MKFSRNVPYLRRINANTFGVIVVLAFRIVNDISVCTITVNRMIENDRNVS